MPTINKPKKKQNYKKHGRNEEVAEIYNSPQWKKLRKAYFIQNPLCEMCLEENKVTPAEEVHHVKPILTGASRLEMEELAYNPNNLRSLCQFHHHLIHKEMKK